MLREADKLNDIINTLLELAQVNLDKSELQQIKLDELLWEVTDEWSKPGSSKISVEYGNPDESVKYTIMGNSRLLFIALSNILKNAIKFSDNKDVYCKLTLNDDFIVISITDKGIGIAESDFEKIFQPFYRAANAQPFSGSGVGLSLTERIIRLHNGKIEVTSKLNEGSEFHIFFPRQTH